MKTHIRIFILLLLLLNLVLIAMAQKSGKSENNLQYIDSEKPSTTPKIFAPDFISKKDESEYGSVFSKRGTEFFYAVNVNGKAEIRYTKLKDGKWIKPKTIISHETNSYNDPFLSPNEDRLYYIRICLWIRKTRQMTTTFGSLKGRGKSGQSR